MALKQTVNQMRSHLTQIMQDLDKADRGNKAASQRVRTGTIRLEKIAKLFRKESIKEEKTHKGKKKPAAAKMVAKKAPVKKAAKPVAKKAMKAKPKAAMKSKKATAGTRALSVQRRQTAKLPSRKAMR